jgi:hypothetical protein
MISPQRINPSGSKTAQPTTRSAVAQSAAAVAPAAAVPIQGNEEAAFDPTVHFDTPSSPGWRGALSQALGAPLTYHNPVWTPRSLGLLRKLQQRLLDCAREDDGAARKLLLSAVDVVEEQVRWRLWLQLQDSGAGISGFAEAAA